MFQYLKSKLQDLFGCLLGMDAECGHGTPRDRACPRCQLK